MKDVVPVHLFDVPMVLFLCEKTTFGMLVSSQNTMASAARLTLHENIETYFHFVRCYTVKPKTCMVKQFF